MAKLYGDDWLADLHDEEEEQVQEDKEESQQVASSTVSDLPPGLEQAALSANVSGPTLSIPKTPPPASRRTLSPLRAVKTTPGSSAGTGKGFLQDSASRRLEASPAQKLKDLKSTFPSTHRGLGFLDASKGAAWKAFPAFPKGRESPNTQSYILGRLALIHLSPCRLATLSRSR